MERAKVIKEEIVQQNMRFLAVYVETKNSCLVLLSESEDRLGTLAIAVPKPKDLLGTTSSSILLGDRSSISTRIFAEYLASIKNKIALVSVYLKSIDELQARSILKKLLQKVVHTVPEKEEASA